MLLYISHHEETARDIAPLTAALHSKGLSCTSNAADADAILLYISPAYIAPHSRTIAEADRFLQQQAKLTVAIFAWISVPDVKRQADAPGWDDEGILRRLTSNMGIDMRHRQLDFDGVAADVEKSVEAPRGRGGAGFEIFLSHAGEDKEFIRVLEEVLGQRYRCFLDEKSLVPGNVAGESGTEQLIDAAEKARLGVFVLSDRSIKKRWPLREVGIFQRVGTPILIVWYQFLQEQAEQYVANRPADLPREAHAFLQQVLQQEAGSMRSIWYPPGAAWNNPHKEQYARHVKSKIDALSI